MPRPRPLSNISSALPSSDNQILTPRTPHTRSGRAEEGYTEFELQQITDNDDEYAPEGQQQAVPLLSSSASDSFPSNGYRNRGDEYDDGKKSTPGKLDFSTILSRLPLVLGSLLAGVLFFLTVLSYKHPEKVQKYFGTKPPGTQTPSGSSGASQDNNTTLTISHPTLSYENYTHFPLLASEYRAECNKLHQGYMSHGKYWEPHEMGVMDVVHHDDKHDYKLPEGEKTAVCTSTITYMLDGQVGLLADLALMAQAAALAREQNRTFFVDDTYWNRGKWTDHFQDVRARQPGPERGCRAPPPEELVACPRLARHWVINSRTAKFHFGHEFLNEFEDPYAHQLNRFKPIYEAARISLRDTIRPNAQNAALIRSTRSELSTLLSHSNAKARPYIGIHVRRGDRKPSWAYNGKYVSTEEFTKAISDTWTRLYPDKLAKEVAIYFASDAPSAQSEFLESSEGPQYTMFSLAQSKDPQIQALASPRDYVQEEFNKLEESVRVQATRGMIVDFALLNGLWAWEGEIIPDATICTISSNVCKLSAVALGWEKAFGAVDDMGYLDEKGKRWVEIDLKGRVVPVWEPFELFTHGPALALRRVFSTAETVNLYETDARLVN